MLQALTDQGEYCTLALMERWQIQNVRKTPFYCPNCKERVVIKAGEKVIPHFAHFASSSCTSGRMESDYHRRGKILLYEWLQRQNLNVEIEKYLPQIKQRPDLFTRIQGKPVAIEFQCAKVDTKIILLRNKGYRSMGIIPIWILGANQFKRLGKQKIKIKHFTLQLLQKNNTSNSSAFLLYFCPITKIMIKASDLFFLTNQQAIAHFTFQRLDAITLSQLFQESFFSRENLYQMWLYEKRKFRLTNPKYHSREQKFRHWLYKKGFHVEQLPASIHLPIKGQYTMKVPVWEWQTRLMIDLLALLPLGAVFSAVHAQQLLSHCEWHGHFNREQGLIPITSYLHLLVRLGILKRMDQSHYKKCREIRFYQHIETALKADQAIIRYLINQNCDD